MSDISVTKNRIERCLDQRATVTELHEGVLAAAEARSENPGLTDVEESQVQGYRTRQEELDTEIEELYEVLKREEQSAQTSRLVRAHLNGQAPGVEADGDLIQVDKGGVGFFLTAAERQGEWLGRAAQRALAMLRVLARAA